MHSAIKLSRCALLGSALALAVCISIGAAEARGYRVLTIFDADTGSNPEFGAPTIDGDGNVYGTTFNGGPDEGYGVVFKIAPDRTETLLHVFRGSDGAGPYGGVLYDKSSGKFFGTAGFGGAHGDGVVYSIDPDGTYAVLHNFDGNDGRVPIGPPARDPRTGAFYGVTSFGGSDGYGTVWMLSLNGTFAVLHSFTYSTGDGLGPFGGLVRARGGDFFGTTASGGANQSGTVYEISPAGKFTLLHSFGGNDGADPGNALIAGKDGSLYGTANYGGAGGAGTVFKLAPDGTFSTVHSFSNDANGGYPLSSLVMLNGKLYGTASSNGDPNHTCGVVFEVGMDGSETVLHTFTGVPGDGCDPESGLARGVHGVLYGETYGGGTGSGTVFRIKR